MQKANEIYAQTKFTTVGQGELLLLLYDGALKFLTQAKEKMLAKDYTAKGQLISKALDVINELDGSLNREAGGDLATNLHQLYFLCSTRLLQANLRMDPALLDSVADILKGLRGAYAQIVTKPEAQAAAEQIAAKQTRSSSTSRTAAAPSPAPAFAPGMSVSFARTAYTQMNRMPEPEKPTTESVPGANPSGPVQPPVTTTETAAPGEAAPAAPPLNLGSRRLAASALYGKMAGM